MVQLRTQRTALGLYAVLLVLPTLVLGFLQWNQLVRENASELAKVPRDAEDAALRFRTVLQEELDKLIGAESARGIEQYATYYSPATALAGDFPLLATSLRTEARPVGVIAWFRFDLRDVEDDVEVYFGGDPVGADLRTQTEQATERLCLRFVEGDWIRRWVAIGSEVDRLSLPLSVVAASGVSPDDREGLEAETTLLSDPVRAVAGHFQLQFYRDTDGTPRLVAARRVVVEELPYLMGLTDSLHRLSKGLDRVQGFFIDPQWFFDALPQAVAANVLTKRERFLREGEQCCDGRAEYHAEVRLVRDFAIDTSDPADEDFGKVRIALDTRDIERSFRERVWRFFGLAAMLALTLATGVFLLGRSVRRDLEQAARTENFVNAVTHELRTPLSSIKLHGEMLLDGWIEDPQQRSEYYRRIVRETERLAMLVERVLEKAKLSSGVAEPEAGDLSAAVERQMGRLNAWNSSSTPDLEFDLADDLPAVLLTPDAVGSILVNLVENARKYAPVDASQPGSEPIRIVTRRCTGGAALEVLDRGPGVPESEREHIFEAFYRVGNEATRTTRGTGLGLHLVALHAASCGARARVEARPGGGAMFRVSFREAPSA